MSIEAVSSLLLCAVSDSDIGCRSMVFFFDGSEMDQLNRSQFYPVCQ